MRRATATVRRASYESVIDVKVDGRVLSVLYQDRQTGEKLFVALHEWTTPAQPIDPQDFEPVLDALFKAARDELGVTLVLEHFAERELLVARRAVRKTAHWLRVFGDRVVWMELGRTMEIPRIAKPPNAPTPTEPPPTAWLDLSRVRWKFPAGEQLSAADRARIAGALHLSHEHSDFVLTDHAWQFVVVEVDPKG